jgi:uncharacterized protein
VFEWDDDKAEANRRKHGVSFVEAASAFFDGLGLVQPDEVHSDEEPRQLLLGRSDRGRILVVAYTERADRLRIISARRATALEREDYDSAS